MSKPLSAGGPVGRTVLLVDDDPLFRGLIAIVLGSAGYEVIQTCNGEEALNFVDSNPGRAFDLLITDLIMPRMGGNELASRLLLHFPTLRILFCSGYPKETVLQGAPETAGFLKKPFNSTTLLEAVQAVLNT